ncbi:MAG: hypothetical protein Q8J68_03905 [Methanolobus sp.]|uniref:hypothetical protein n=1 Tax=Methanolobus sp. TaxID=1874737 RepID=UPI00273036B3|nr:hypothetical protein [Methanolobus sp.]MDP2216416.1 hypothetical protein [Methanolobus sp.]
MDKRVVVVSLVLVAAIAGVSVLPSDDPASMNKTITGINGTNSITMVFDADNTTMQLYGYDELDRETFSVTYIIPEK